MSQEKDVQFAVNSNLENNEQTEPLHLYNMIPSSISFDFLTHNGRSTRIPCSPSSFATGGVGGGSSSTANGGIPFGSSPSESPGRKVARSTCSISSQKGYRLECSKVFADAF